MKRYTAVCLMTIICFGIVVLPVNAKFRDAVQFKDNSFVGMSKVEIFHSYRVISGSDSESFDGSILEYQVTAGLMTNFEVGLNLPVKFFDNGTQGLGDFTVFQRFKFTQETESLPESSGGIELIFPSGNENAIPPTGTDEFNARLFATVGHSIDRDLRWLANAGVRFHGDDRFNERWNYNASLRYQTNALTKYTLELNGRTGGLRDDSELFVSPGIIFQAESGFSIITSVPVGLTEDSSDYEPTIQFAHEF